MGKVIMMTDKQSTRTESYPFATLTITNSTLSGCQLTWATTMRDR